LFKIQTSPDQVELVPFVTIEKVTSISNHKYLKDKHEGKNHPKLKSFLEIVKDVFLVIDKPAIDQVEKLEQNKQIENEGKVSACPHHLVDILAVVLLVGEELRIPAGTDESPVIGVGVFVREGYELRLLLTHFLVGQLLELDHLVQFVTSVFRDYLFTVA
jgi:hypothetical protein